VAVLQPHTFTRPMKFVEDFAKSLSEADHVYLCDIFASAREKSGSFTIEDLQNMIDGSKMLKLDNTAVLNSHKNSVILFMGAGDIQKYEEEFKKIS